MVYVRRSYTAQKMKFSIMEVFSKCDQIRRKLQIWSNLLKRSLMENFVFCAVKIQYRTCRVNERQVCRQSKSVSLVYKACSPCDVNVVTESNRSGISHSADYLVRFQDILSDKYLITWRK